MEILGYKLSDTIAQFFLYSRSIIFKETKPSSVTMQLEQTKEKYVIQLPTTPKKFKPRPLERQEVEECLMSLELLDEEGEPKHELEPKPDLV